MLKTVIARLCTERGISISYLEKSIGIANSSINRWDTSYPRVDNLQKVAKYFGVSVDYLLQEDSYEEAAAVFEEKRNTENSRRATDSDAENILQELSTILKNYGGDKLTPETNKVPIIGSVKCGVDGLAYEYTDSYILVDETLHGTLFALRTRGDSMINEGINEDDLAIIREQNDVENGEIAAVLIDGEEAALKRIVKLPGGIALESANPAYKTRYFMQEDANRIKILGKLIEIRKRF